MPRRSGQQLCFTVLPSIEVGGVIIFAGGEVLVVVFVVLVLVLVVLGVVFLVLVAVVACHYFYYH